MKKANFTATYSRIETNKNYEIISFWNHNLISTMIIMNLIFGFQQSTDPRAMEIENLKEPETNSGTEFKFNILSIPNNSKMIFGV